VSISFQLSCLLSILDAQKAVTSQTPDRLFNNVNNANKSLLVQKRCCLNPWVEINNIHSYCYKFYISQNMKPGRIYL